MIQHDSQSDRDNPSCNFLDSNNPTEFDDDYIDIPDEWLPHICGAGQNTGRNNGDIFLFDYQNLKVPCIMLDDHKYNLIERAVYRKSPSINTNLYIFDDKQGTVFVEMKLDTSPNSMLSDISDNSTCDVHDSTGTIDANLDDSQHIRHRFIINARQHMSFFEALTKSTMIALASTRAKGPVNENIVLIQLPKPDHIEHALKLIKNGLDILHS